MFTIDDLVQVMPHHENKIILQNDGDESPDYTPYIFADADEFMGSDLYNQIADYDVIDVYAENDGTIWICYFCNIDE